MTLAVVRNIGSGAALRDESDVAAFEQEIVDQYALAMAACRADRRARGGDRR